MAEVDPRRRHLGHPQRCRHQADDFTVGGEPRMTKQFGAQLQRFATRRQRRRQGMEDAVAIAQPGDPLPIEQMGVDPGNLRRHVGAHPERASRQLIDEFESPQLQILAGAGEQGIEVLEQGRHDQFVAVHLRTDQAVDAAAVRSSAASDGSASAICSGNSQFI
jgi:hypothetical protein